MSDWSGAASESTTTALAYASSANLLEFLGRSVELPENVDALLCRASEIIDAVTLGRVDTSVASDVEAAKQATCAQIEFWLEVGEENDISGPVETKQASKVTLGYGSGGNRIAPLYLAPRAERILFNAGLLSRAVKLS
jgi:hypothetical protein